MSGHTRGGRTVAVVGALVLVVTGACADSGEPSLGDVATTLPVAPSDTAPSMSVEVRLDDQDDGRVIPPDTDPCELLTPAVIAAAIGADRGGAPAPTDEGCAAERDGSSITVELRGYDGGTWGAALSAYQTSHPLRTVASVDTSPAPTIFVEYAHEVAVFLDTSMLLYRYSDELDSPEPLFDAISDVVIDPDAD